MPPLPPDTVEPDPSWEHYGLYRAVREAVAAIPPYFRTETSISGIAATDIHTLNTVLGATIENQVVQTLNVMRKVWDPEGKYALYSFIRQSQTFPDVVLRKTTEDTPILGIELKGWYLLAKEGEPSFRYAVTPKACAPQDLLVVVPWVLAQVISGIPVVFEPFIASARYAAEYRNYYWQHLRKTKLDTSLKPPRDAHPYPGKKSEQVADVPASDSGGNFGRVARSGVMDDYRDRMMNFLLCGIEVNYWLEFFKAFQDATLEADIRQKIDMLRDRILREREEADSPLMIMLEQIEKMISE